MTGHRIRGAIVPLFTTLRGSYKQEVAERHTAVLLTAVCRKENSGE